MYRISEEGKNLIISLQGDLDHHMSLMIRETIDDKIKANGIENIVFDFQNTTFMDSSGIGLIMGRYKLISKNGGKIQVVNTNSAINRIFEISGLYKIVSMK